MYERLKKTQAPDKLRAMRIVELATGSNLRDLCWQFEVDGSVLDEAA
jgi:hypothetical protein